MWEMCPVDANIMRQSVVRRFDRESLHHSQNHFETDNDLCGQSVLLLMTVTRKLNVTFKFICMYVHT